ncbi:MAG TPA: 2-C-methyl-D-erythritol 2,4-cyclodiphosphate synthase [Pseudomonadales bacterium]|nr:2-C-methyl-D-erythritol 2,4-cyclodiphosphate synthase [Gammaproteobacteria bacterium]MDP6026077.1 2-C-methyl-D-erythritol 2,4-cyclodiphosphate synthase [Pseudomonadales bacterium]MDP6316945.1 2-C-methyl-D-erythritol 2,4-cyclodiphosphate synthase [Pseudomonadales bacterium]HJP52595.1 2-C-methyl-D-erythritol 2,4-cyclodiphosphate synthase [Pseudomonadales bacterium]
MRIGSGFDAHRFGEARAAAIKIGGVEIPFDREVLAHSDGDVVLHALCDAMLGALALGDIGQHFPDSDPQYQNIDSRDLLRLTAKKIAGEGFNLLNADITLISQVPRISGYVNSMRECIAEDLDVDVSMLSIKATTTEKMGFIGREEGLAAQAVVLLSE